MDTEEKSTDTPSELPTQLGLPEQLAQPERRKRPRYPLEEAASLVLIQHNSTVACDVLDLSLGGCRIRLLEPHAMGLMMRVEVVFKILGVPFRLPGVIQWVDRRRGAGIRFLEMPQRRSDALLELIEEVRADFEARAAKDASEAALTAESAAPAEAASPAAIPWPTSSRPAKTSLPETRIAAAPDVAASIKKIEAIRTVPTQGQTGRRTAPRHPVDTEAEIHLIDIAAHVHGRILDLSLGGCHIRSDERFPVGIFRRVETEFRLDGLPFRLAGVTQTLYDRRNVGIRFLDMSERKREQLTQLIRELEEVLAQENGPDATDAPFLPSGSGNPKP